MKENYEGNVFSPWAAAPSCPLERCEMETTSSRGASTRAWSPLNLPQIGILSKGDGDAFWKLLDQRLQLCFEALMCRHNALKTSTPTPPPSTGGTAPSPACPRARPSRPLLYGGYSSISLGYIRPV